MVGLVSPVMMTSGQKGAGRGLIIIDNRAYAVIVNQSVVDPGLNMDYTNFYTAMLNYICVCKAMDEMFSDVKTSTSSVQMSAPGMVWRGVRFAVSVFSMQ